MYISIYIDHYISSLYYQIPQNINCILMKLIKLINYFILFNNIKPFTTLFHNYIL